VIRHLDEGLVTLGLILSLAAPAYSTDEPNSPQALVEIRIVQLNAEATEAGPNPTARAAAVEPEVLHQSGPGETIYVAPLGRDLLLGGQVLPASRGNVCQTQPVSGNQSATGGGTREPRPAEAKATPAKRESRTAGSDSLWSELSAPRIISNVGQPAAMDVGAKVPYMVKRPDGSFVLEQGEAEGLHIDLEIGQATASTVRIDRLEVKLTQLVGREPIPDVPFDIGKPRYHTRHMRVALRISPDKVAIIPLPVDQEQVFILVTARLVQPQP
jgi:hypothetical protein